MAKKHLLAIGATAALVVTLAGCSTGGDAAGGGSEIAGEITVLTNRTDLVDTLFHEYAAAFEKKYPGTTVKFEGITNYDQDVTTRLAGGAAGDVLALPNGLTSAQVQDFFEPLGSTDDLSEKYRFAGEYAYDGQTYALSIGGVASGIVVNKRIWAEAGITAPPKTPQDFLDGLKAIKAKTDAIPYYTNYKDGWPVTFFDNERAIFGDENILETWPEDEALWEPGKYAYIADGLLYNIVHEGLSEEDPLTTNWEQSKPDIATGKIASMLLGSWAVPQMKTAAEEVGADPDDIAFWPFPYQTDGRFHSKISGDRASGVAATSKNKATAHAWLEWFVAESGFAENQGAIPPAIDSPFPQAIKDFADTGVELLELKPATTNKGKESAIYKAAEIDGTIYRQQLIDVARGAADGDWESFIADLNERWGAAQAEIMG
ncbi:ABC transporter substrate-binding protein [Microbacterium ulmi]|uniref:Carbohydrate ABC transporter substrate-binding protein n=1 Tax=Microbacterium ulmi TaxID=179095 RepID=A0A7Y2M2D2_9MICO|nr:ABC transporter substrate-binding protein [Microbacterium ulmi]NII69908.1 ABC-type glycerol-3-phosphate transport system substrate-binding protein [Microbacterium ulmi]NNH03828.1 carbohydrate ABC transporter substrate-binding protein [Microbacterium ulmi]